jgi:DNA-binding transcriptional MerR regulator
MSEFPIRILSELSGVPAATLRAWERRYGLLKPKRTSKGHRLYTQADLETVRQVVGLLEREHTISKAVKLVREGGVDEKQDPQGEQSPWVSFRKRLLRGVESFDEARLDAVYQEALSLYPIGMVSTNLLQPVLVMLGERWEERPAGIAEEHFFTAYLRNKIGARMHHLSSGCRGRRLLMACMPGERHEFGLLLFALSALSRGYRILYLGADLPLEQVRQVVAAAPVDGILLSGTRLEATAQLLDGIAGLAAELSQPVMLGGEASERFASRWRATGAAVLGSSFGPALERLEGLLPAFGTQ